jgi:hypothetical protein
MPTGSKGVNRCHHDIQQNSKRKQHAKCLITDTGSKRPQCNLKCLFTYRYYPELEIYHTANTLDESLFAPMKTLLEIHRDIGMDMKQKLIMDYMGKLRKSIPKTRFTSR